MEQGAAQAEPLNSKQRIMNTWETGGQRHQKKIDRKR